MSYVKVILLAVGEFFGFQRKRLELKNTVEMRKRAERQEEVKKVSEVEKAVADKDEERIRKELAE